MKPNRSSVPAWTFEHLQDRLAAVFEAMTGARPGVRTTPLATAPPASETGGTRWRQTFNGVAGATWIQSSQQAWTEASNQILRAAEIDKPDEATLTSTWAETLGQALSGLAQDFSDLLGREIISAAGQESPDQNPAHWAMITLQFPGSPPVELAAGIEDSLLDSLVIEEPAHQAAATAGASGAGLPSGSISPGSPPPGLTSKTFDLLLDVELPVSVSFGRAQVPLKDVIKLTTGAIVELNRSISEPVEVIVNNCVIARGEVVVVEGNFGVRIREVVSRQDRLRTLT